MNAISLSISLPIIFALASILTKTSLIKEILFGLGFAALLILNLYFITYILANPDTILTYSFSNFNPTLGVEYSLSSPIVLMLILNGSVPFLWFITIANRKATSTFFILISTCTINAIILSGDLFNIYIFYEITTISTTIAIALDTNTNNKLNYIAAFNYLKFAILGSCFFLIGSLLLYAITHTLNLNNITSYLNTIQTLHNKSLAILATLMFTLSILIKSGIPPLHRWMFTVYKDIQPQKLTIISSINSKVGCWILFVLLCGPLQNTWQTFYPHFQIITLAIALTSIFLTIQFLKNDKILNSLIYSCLINTAFIAIGILTFNSYGINAGIANIIFHGFLQFATLALIIQFLPQLDGNTPITDLNNLYRTNLIIAIILTSLILATAGIPFTGTFIVKSYLLLGLLKSHSLITTAATSICFVISFFGYCKFIHPIFSGTGSRSHTLPTYQIIIYILILSLAIYFGINKPIFQNIITNNLPTTHD